MTKDRLRRGDCVFGTMAFECASQGLPAIWAAAGADYCIYDMEHSGFSLETVKGQVAAARGSTVAIMARPPATEYHFVSRLLDVGVTGILAPMIESAAQAEQLVSWTQYPPNGRRGGMFGCAHDGYASGSIAGAIEKANRSTIVMALIESVEGLERVGEILAVPGIDVAHLGHVDLSLSMGIPGEITHPRIQAAIDRIAQAARDHGKTAACLVRDVPEAVDRIGRGYTMISYSNDIGLLRDSLGDGIAAIKRTQVAS